MPPYTPYKTLDDVKEAIDKFDECCLDLLDVLDKLKPAGINPKSLNPLASEIHRSLQRIAPQARARIELTKERKKDLSAQQYVLPQNWPYLCRRYEETIRYVDIADIPALFEIVPPERATLLHDTQVMMERAGTGKFRVQQMDDDCGIISRLHMLGPANGVGEGSRSGDQDSETANDNAVHLTWAASGVPFQPGGRVRVEFVPYDQRTQLIVSLEVSDNKEVPRVVHSNLHDAGWMNADRMDPAEANYEAHPSRTTLIKQVIKAKTLKRQYDAMQALASFHVSDLASHLGLDRKELKEFVQDGVDVWFDGELERRRRGAGAAAGEGATEEMGEEWADDLPPANFGPMPQHLIPLEDMLTKVSLAQSLQERHDAQIELLNALAGDLVRYCALDGEILGVLLRGWMRGILGSSPRSIVGSSSSSMGILGSSSRDITGSSSTGILGPSSKAVDGISLPKGTKRRPVPTSVLRRRAGFFEGLLPALPNVPSSSSRQLQTEPIAPANVVADVEMSAPAAPSTTNSTTSVIPATAALALPAPPATSVVPAPATPEMPTLVSPARSGLSTSSATTSSSSKKRKRASDVEDVVTTTPIRQLRSTSRLLPANLHASLPGPSTLRIKMPIDGPSTPVDTPSTPRKDMRTQTTTSVSPAQFRSSPATSRVIPARDRINTLRTRSTRTKPQPSPDDASTSMSSAEDASPSTACAEDNLDDQDDEPQPKRRRSARFSR